MKTFLIIGISLYLSIAIKAQSPYQPYSYQFYQKLNSKLYTTKRNLHTAIKPLFLDDSLLNISFDSVLNADRLADTANHSWLYRKLFMEHLLTVVKSDYSFYADYLPDLTLGRDLPGKKITWLNTRGFQAGINIGSKFTFYTSGYENQAVFPAYLNTYINQIGLVTGQAYDHSKGADIKDWSYVTSVVSYSPVKYLNISFGQDKTFIGDGYRSLLLSDFAAPYPFLKLTGNLGQVRYMTMWSFMDDPSAAKYDGYGNERRKWGVFQYLDWNINNRLSAGFFESVIWADADDQGHKRGFDFKYISPIIFLRDIAAASGSPDNTLLGFTIKYKLTDRVTAYGQLALDEFQAKDFFSNNGSSRNKYGYQLGLRGSDLFHVKTLNYLLEFNAAKPYTYSELAPILNYAEQNEPLAHPFGANFRECAGLINYTINRFDFSAELDYSNYGLDIGGLNYGKDLFETYQSAPKYYSGNYIGQGIKTNMYYAESKVAFVLNPRYNLRLEIGALFRAEKNSVFNDRTTMLNFGLRSSFRNLYTDISRYKLR
jgi:hypothetical protein